MLGNDTHDEEPRDWKASGPTQYDLSPQKKS